MGKFNRGGKSSGGYRGDRSFDKKSFGGRGFERGGDRQMFDAVCSTCGDECQIPFRPSGDRPVFCSNCFGKQKQSSAPSGRFGGISFDRSDRGSKQMHEAVCDSCGDKCEVPFRPTGDKPVYCKGCFGKTDSGTRGKGSDQMKEQFNMLNAKLDKVLSLLNSEVEPKISKKKETKKIVEELVTEDKEKENLKVTKPKEKKKTTKKTAKKK